MTRRKSSYARISKERWVAKGSSMSDVEYGRLRRKLRIMGNDKQYYGQDVQNVLRKQGREIDTLSKENAKIHHSLLVSYGDQSMAGDIDNTRKLRELLIARDDYERLEAVETSFCKELDVKISGLRGRLADAKCRIGGDEADLVKRLDGHRCLSRTENRVNKSTTNFCSLLKDNDGMRSQIRLLVKEKNTYHDLYRRIAERISQYKKRIMNATKEASSHYEQRLEAVGKMKTVRDRCKKDESMFQSEMKVLQRMIAHDSKMKQFMSMKENERLTYKAEEAEKRAKMSVKEKALNEETSHVRRYEELFLKVRSVTGHENLENVVNDFTVKDGENFAKFDYVSELNHDVEKLQESIQIIKDNMKTMHAEDEKTEHTSEDSINQLRTTKQQMAHVLGKEEIRQGEIDELLENVCAVVHMLYKEISCSTDTFKFALAFDDRVSVDNVKAYLSMIEQRCMELICILKFIGLHQDHHGNLLRAPRSVHRIRPRGPSRILLELMDKPMMPSISTPNISDDLLEAMVEEEDTAMPLDVAHLREKAMRKIAKQEAAGLLNQSAFVQDKRGKAKPRKK